MRVLLIALVLVLGVATVAAAQFGASFPSRTAPSVALLGCEVAGPRDPDVIFLQVAGRGFGRGVIGSDRLEGESCAEALSALFDAGFGITESRPVRRSSTKEIIVYDLIGD